MSDNTITAPKVKKPWKKNSWGRGRGNFHGNNRRPSENSPISNTSSTLHDYSNNLNVGGKYIQLEINGTPTLDSFQPHWRNYISLYAFEDSFSPSKLKAALEYLKSRSNGIETTDDLFNFKRFYLSFNDLINSQMLKEKWPSLESEIDGSPDLVMGIFGLARYDLWKTEVKVRGTLPAIR